MVPEFQWRCGDFGRRTAISELLQPLLSWWMSDFSDVIRSRSSVAGSTSSRPVIVPPLTTPSLIFRAVAGIGVFNNLALGHLCPPSTADSLIFMVAVCNRADHYVFILWFLLSFFFFFFYLA